MLRVTILEDRCVPAVSFRFDATFDRSGFFANPDVLAALDRAGQAVGGRLQDTLSAINPAGDNIWEARVYDPVADTTRRLPNLQVAQNEIIVFVTAADLEGATLGETTAGAATPAGSDAWKRTVLSRGQSGALADPVTDYGPWGGMVAFDALARWSFGSAPVANRIDFESVAQHELGHLLGFGIGAQSFDRHVIGRSFDGENSVREYGGPVPLDTDDRADHWAEGVESDGREASLTPTVARGTRRALTSLDFAALADIGWQVSGVNVAAALPPVVPGGGGTAVVAVGADEGSAPSVTLLDADGRKVDTFKAFEDDYTGGVRVASGDFNNDGILDVAVATGPGVQAEVRVLDGLTRAELFRVNPYESSYTGGAFVSVGDLDGDGIPDLVVTPDVGGGPRVKVYRGAGFGLMADFFGIADSMFRGGARTAIGDINGDSVGDLLVAAGAGGGPRVAGFTGQSVSLGNPAPLFGDFFAFESTLRNGVYLAAVDMNRDGFAEVITGAGPGGGPRVSAWDGRGLTQDNLPTRVTDFFAGDAGNRGGIRVGNADLDGDGVPDLVTGVGQGAGSSVGGYRRASGSPEASFEYTVFPEFYGGVFVG